MNKILLAMLCGMATWWAIPPLSAQFRTTVPYLREKGKIIVDASVDGHSGRFLVDTGAPCSLTHPFMKKAGIAPTDSTRVQDSNGNRLTTRVAEIASLQLGTVSFNALQALCLEENNIVETFHIDGIIGYNLMKMGIVKFDNAAHTFTFTNSEQGLGLDSLSGLPLIDDFFLALLPVRLGENAQDTVMFDTGASGFYAMSTRSFHRLDRRPPSPFTLLGKGKGILSLGAAGVERASTKYRLKIPQFTVGEAPFRNVTTITTDAADSRIGSELLTHGNVIIDYRKRLFYYLPFAPEQIPDMYEKEWDAVITVIDNYLTVGMVWNPEQSPLKGGERIVEIEGRKYDKVDLYSATTGGVKLPDKEARIKYIDATTGEIKETTLRRK